MVHLIGGSWVKVFEHSSHQVEASGDEDVDLGCVAERSSFGYDAGFNWKDRLGWVCHDWIPALSDPLEGAEDAREDQGVRSLSRSQGQAVLDEQLCTFVIPQAVVETPAPFVIQAASQHVLHWDVEVLLVWEDYTTND